MKVKYTKFQIALEIVGLLLVVGMIAVVCIYWNQIPQKIPGHYNAMGEVDRWGSKSEIIISPIVSSLLYILLTVLSFFPKTWNVGVKITELNREAVYCCTRNILSLIKVELVGMFFYTTYYTATAQSLPAYFIPVFLFVVFGTVIYYVIRILQIGKKKSLS